MLFVNWDMMDKLSEDAREEFKAFLTEDCLVAKTSLQSERLCNKNEDSLMVK